MVLDARFQFVFSVGLLVVILAAMILGVILLKWEIKKEQIKRRK